MSRRWLYRAVSAGEFPKPVKIGKATRWRRADLDAWIAEL
jgi:predicted DNA-binding transcriptional regulator AlpA